MGISVIHRLKELIQLKYLDNFLQLVPWFWLIKMPVLVVFVLDFFYLVLCTFSVFSFTLYKRKDGLKGHCSNELWARRWQMVTSVELVWKIMAS